MKNKHLLWIIPLAVLIILIIGYIIGWNTGYYVGMKEIHYLSLYKG